MPEEPTAPDLVERMRRLVDVFGEGGVDAVMPFYAPGAVWAAAERLAEERG
jgi:hypothetical protein